jgi:hypothetical protein
MLHNKYNRFLVVCALLYVRFLESSSDTKELLYYPAHPQ